jgi:hypothetical protein
MPMSAQRLTDNPRATDANGNPLSGAKWKFYATGTTTPQAVYSNAALSVSLGSVVTADGAGKFVSVYFDTSLAYRGILETSAGVQLADIDPINDSAGDLSASGGSNLIGYISAGAGAVARTVQDRLRERVSVKDFGALIDGVTDDTDAWEAAIAYCKSTYAKLWMPAGISLISRTLVVDWNGWSIEGDGFARSIIQQTTANPCMVINAPFGEWRSISCNGGFNKTTRIGTYGVIMRNAGNSRFYDLGSNWNTADGILFDSQYDPATFGVPAGNNNLVKLWGAFSNENGGRGISSELRADNNSIEIICANCSGNDGDGMLYRSEGWHVFGGLFEGNGGYGIRLSLPTDPGVSVNARIIAPWVESNALGGIRGDGNSQRNMIELSNRAQTYSAAPGSSDVLIYFETNGTVTGDGAVASYHGQDSGRAFYGAAGVATDIDTWLTGKGVGKFLLGPSGKGFKDILQGTSAYTGTAIPSGTNNYHNGTISVPGAALGDKVDISLDTLLQGATLTATVSAANTVRWTLVNSTNAVMNSVSGTLYYEVWKR